MALNDVLNERRFQIAFAVGVLYWLGLSLPAGHHHEAWNAWFFIPGYMFLIIAAGIIGWKFHTGGWRSGRDIGIGMTVSMLVIGIFTSNGFGLLPLGLIMIAALTLPLIGASWLGAYLKTHDVTGKNL